MAIYKRDIASINLETGTIHRTFLNHSIGYKDQKADHFGIRVFRDGEPVDLTGVSVQGVFMPPQGDPIAITSGNIVSGNEAEVVLPQACYNYDGQFCLAIKLVDSNNSVTGTMRIVDGMVDNTHASGTVAPTSAVPTYQEILSTYDAMVAATAAANGAIAATYSISSTYKVGDYCIHDGGLYRCTTAITTAEAWTSGHWTSAKIGPDVSDLKSALEYQTESEYLLSGGTYLNLQKGMLVCATDPVNINGADYSRTDWQFCVYPCQAGDVFTLSGDGGANARLYCFVDSSYNAVTNGRAASDSKLIDFTITAPTGSAYFIFNNRTRYTTPYVLKGKKILDKLIDYVHTIPTVTTENLDSYLENTTFILNSSSEVSGLPISSGVRRLVEVFSFSSGASVLQRVSTCGAQPYMQYSRYYTGPVGSKTWSAWGKDIVQGEDVEQYGYYNPGFRFVMGDVDGTTGENVNSGVDRAIFTPDFINMSDINSVIIYQANFSNSIRYRLYYYNSSKVYTGKSDWQYGYTLTNQKDVAYLKIGLRLGDGGVISSVSACRNLYTILAASQASEKAIYDKAFAASGKHGQSFNPIAHRGLWVQRPTLECTEYAYKRAVSLGYKLLETDLMVTSDGAFVLAHDDDLYNRLGEHVLISEHTLAELKEYTFGTDQKIMTLQEFILLCRCMGAMPVIDLKNMSQANVNNFADIVDGLEIYSINGTIETLGFILAKRPNQHCRRSYDNYTAYSNDKTAYAALREAYPNAKYAVYIYVIDSSWSSVLDTVLAEIHAAEMEIGVSEINSPKAVYTYITESGRYNIEDIIVGDDFNPLAYLQDYYSM